jgi:hypothetical protein
MSDTETTQRPSPPPLEFEPPRCSVCGEQTVVEYNQLNCPDCEVSWPADGYHLHDGSWDHGDDAEQCPSVVTDDRYGEHRCWLTARHLGEHRNPDGSWTNEQAQAPATSGSAA